MKKTYTQQNSAISTILGIAIIAIVLVAGITVAYYFISYGNMEQNPIPTPETTETPPLTNSTEPIANFHNGVQTAYVITNYDPAGQATQQNTTLQQFIGEDSYNNNACWKLIQTIQTTTENTMTTSINTFYIYKENPYEAIHLSVKNYTADGSSTSDEFDINPAQNRIGILLARAIDPRNATSYEDVQVTAGLFEHCTKVQITDSQGTAYVWVHPDVPGWGIVKMEMYNQGKLVSAINLNATTAI